MAIFSNQATLTYTGGSTSSNIVTGEIFEVLDITKQAVNEAYRAGDTVTYVVTLVNSGATALNGLTLTDDLGAYPFGLGTLVPASYVAGSVLYYINGVQAPDPTVSAGPPLVMQNISVPAGGNAVIIYSVRLNEFAPITTGGTVTNTASASGAGLTEPIEAVETITVIDETALSISKALCPASVPENGEITYTFVISNRGNTAAVATDNLAVTDTFNPPLSDITVTLNGEALVAGTDYTYDETTGVFQTTAGRITVPAATTVQDPITGIYTVTPGESVLTVTGRI